MPNFQFYWQYDELIFVKRESKLGVKEKDLVDMQKKVLKKSTEKTI